MLELADQQEIANLNVLAQVESHSYSINGKDNSGWTSGSTNFLLVSLSMAISHSVPGRCERL